MANQQSSKGPSLIGQTIGPTAPVVAGEDNTGLVKPLQLDASGNLLVAVTGAGSGGTSSVDGTAFVANTTAGTPAMGVYESSPTALTDGDLGVVSLASDRSLNVTIVGGGGSGGTSSSFGAAFPATGTAIGIADPGGNMLALSAETFDYDTGGGTALVTAPGLSIPASGGPLAVLGGHGTAAQALRVELPTDGTGVIATVGTITNPVTVAQATASSLNAQVAGDVAHDSADSGNPVKVGSIAKTSLPTAVAANNRANLISDVYGRPFVRHGTQGPAGNYWDVQHAPTSNTLATASQASAGAGVRNVCTGFTVTLAATATAPAAIQLYVMVVDGATTGTTYLWRSAISLPATAGAITSFVRSGLWLPGTAATAMTVEFSAAGGSNTVESVTMEGTTVAE